MNTLSWLIYAADAAGNVGTLCDAIALIGGISLTIVSAIVGSEGDYNGPLAALLNKLWITAACLAVLACILPSRTTVYAIAASEMGEKAFNTETGGKAVKALNAWLDRQIAAEEPGGRK